MNLRCIYCQTPFTLSRPEMLNGIIMMNEKHQNHYDAHCPRCRRANSISRQRMELFYPNWQEAAKQQASAPPPPPVTELKVEAAATALAKTEPLPKSAMKVGKKAPAVKTTADKKPAAKAAKKPAAESSSKAKKPADSTTAKAKKPVAKTAEPKTKKK